MRPHLKTAPSTLLGCGSWALTLWLHTTLGPLSRVLTERLEILNANGGLTNRGNETILIMMSLLFLSSWIISHSFELVLDLVLGCGSF